VVWLGFQLVIIPALGIAPGRRTGAASSSSLSPADHALYGFVLSEIRRAHKGMR
jgi:hypothetical protein